MASIVGLTLLEIIRRQDLPMEILEAEDPTITMPRRLGLSDVIDRQIRVYKEEVRKGRKMSDDEVYDLVRLVMRRPDSEEVLFRSGRILAGGEGREEHRRVRVLPRSFAFTMARRACARRLKKLFGRSYGRFEGSPFTLEASSHLLLEADPGGEACQLVTGLAEAVVQRFTGNRHRVAHDRCIARKDSVCRWSVLEEEAVGEPEGLGDFMFEPEPDVG